MNCKGVHFVASLFPAVSCPSLSDYIRSGTTITNSAIDMIVIMDNPSSIAAVRHWMRDYILWLDSELINNGHGINSSCRNHFSLVWLDSSWRDMFARLFSSDTKITMYPIEKFAEVFETFEQGITYEAPKADAYLDIPTVLETVQLRDSTAECLSSRNLIYLSNSSQFSSNTGILSFKTKLHAQLQAKSISFHTFTSGSNFHLNNGTSSVGHTSSTGFADSLNGNCYRTTTLTSQSSDEVLQDPLSQLAMNASGSIWDVTQLFNTHAQACAFRDVIIDQIEKMVSSCFNCQCPASGQENCKLTNYTEEECKCVSRGGNVSEIKIKDSFTVVH